jgi:hypothetical protein
MWATALLTSSIHPSFMSFMSISRAKGGRDSEAKK